MVEPIDPIALDTRDPNYNPRPGFRAYPKTGPITLAALGVFAPFVLLFCLACWAGRGMEWLLLWSLDKLPEKPGPG